jgi:predicted TIM-barrel fold metal-dependent hydrolase
MLNRRIIDAHHHLGSEPDYAEQLAETCHNLGIVKVCLVCVNVAGDGAEANARTRAAFERHPDLYVGFGGVDLWADDGPDQVQRLHEEGFTGLKFIIPPKAYHDPAFYPTYERAQSLGMPALFHLGIVARGSRRVRVDNNLMRPIYLDTIAREFPELTIIGAHLGNPWYEEATMSCRWNPNLYFDLSGSTLKKKSPQFLGELLWWTPSTFYHDVEGRYAWEKIVFGSDVNHAYVRDVLNDYERTMQALALEPALREKVLYGTMAGILGLKD